MDASAVGLGRPATQSDIELIYHILPVSLGPYVEQTWGVWDEGVQRKRFEEITRVEDHAIVELDGETAGCVCLKKTETEMRLARLFIMPQFQNRGFGTQIMQEILMRADQKRLPIRLRVLRVNPARRFYDRIGFHIAAEDATHYTMVRLPDTPLQPTAEKRGG